MIPGFDCLNRRTSPNITLNQPSTCGPKAASRSYSALHFELCNQTRSNNGVCLIFIEIVRANKSEMQPQQGEYTLSL